MAFWWLTGIYQLLCWRQLYVDIRILILVFEYLTQNIWTNFDWNIWVFEWIFRTLLMETCQVLCISYETHILVKVGKSRTFCTSRRTSLFGNCLKYWYVSLETSLVFVIEDKLLEGNVYCELYFVCQPLPAPSVSSSPTHVTYFLWWRRQLNWLTFSKFGHTLTFCRMNLAAPLIQI